MSEPKTTDFLTIAKFYIDRMRWPVYPLRGIRSDGSCSCGNPKCDRAGKHPLTRHGKKDATFDLELLEMMIDGERNPGWATVTGLESMIAVIDIDGPEGEESIRALSRQFYDLPPTVEVRSGSGGRHLYYRFMKGVSTSSSKLAPKIDLRAHNGSIILPPTLHRSGGRYEWIRPPWQHIFTPLPGWIPELLAFHKAQEAEARQRKDGRKLAGLMRDRDIEPVSEDNIERYLSDPPFDLEQAPTASGAAPAQSFAGQSSASGRAPASDAGSTSPAGTQRRPSISERAIAASGRPAQPQRHSSHRPASSKSREERLREWRADPARAEDRIIGFANELAGLKEGRRNDTLNRNAYIAFKIARDAGLRDAVVIQAFVNAGKACGLQMPEIIATLRSAQLSSATA